MIEKAKFPLRKNQTPSTEAEKILRPAARPSIPSTRFIALIMNIQLPEKP